MHQCNNAAMLSPPLLTLTQEETEEEKAQAKVPHDYLTPFLPQPIGLHDAPLSKEEAFHSRDGCLKVRVV